MEQVKSCGLTRLIIRDSLLTNITKVSYVFYQAKEEEKKKKEEVKMSTLIMISRIMQH